MVYLLLNVVYACDLRRCARSTHSRHHHHNQRMNKKTKYCTNKQQQQNLFDCYMCDGWNQFHIQLCYIVRIKRISVVWFRAQVINIQNKNFNTNRSEICCGFIHKSHLFTVSCFACFSCQIFLVIFFVFVFGKQHEIRTNCSYFFVRAKWKKRQHWIHQIFDGVLQSSWNWIHFFFCHLQVEIK